MPKVSEQALAECRAAVCVGSPIPINDPALDELVECVRKYFEAVLDVPGGAETWKRDRPKMLFQCACIGSLAALTAALKELTVKEVDGDSLRFAFNFVKAGCDVRLSMDKRLEMFTKYCSPSTTTNVHHSVWEGAFGTR